MPYMLIDRIFLSILQSFGNGGIIGSVYRPITSLPARELFFSGLKIMVTVLMRNSIRVFEAACAELLPMTCS